MKWRQNYCVIFQTDAFAVGMGITSLILYHKIWCISDNIAPLASRMASIMGGRWHKSELQLALDELWALLKMIGILGHLLWLTRSSSLISKLLYFQFSHHKLEDWFLLTVSTRLSFLLASGWVQLMGGTSNILERGEEKLRVLSPGFFLSTL